MVKLNLVSAIDFQRLKGDVIHIVRSRKVGDKWYVDETGPTYANCYEVTAYDDGGLKWLEKNREE